ncbi:hypothetical protein Dimus_006399 [Dionaea muscipula]
MNPEELFNLFSKYGVVFDVFIPKKRNKSGKRFGFIRYRCTVSAEMAILKLNGVWFGKGAMKVKVADYSSEQKGNSVERRGGIHKENVLMPGHLKNSYQNPSWDGGKPKFYKEIVIGAGKSMDYGKTIRVQKAANGTTGILVRPCGGKQVIMTFPTTKIRDKLLVEEQEELRAWFKDFHPWKPSSKVGRNCEV